MFKIFIIEDEEIIAKSLKKELEKWQYNVQYATEFHNIMEQFTAFDPHLVLIDIRLPSFNGYYWCQEIRKVSKVPIIFLSSQSDRMDIVMAIQMGADDFISKPFDLTVAVAKIQALLRRTYDFTEQDDYLNYAGVFLNRNSMVLLYQENEISLTKTEYQILEQLFHHKESFVSREDLMIHLWEDESFIDDNTLAVNIARLRKKLASIGLTSFIVTKKGVGYGLQKDF